jgi:hypothetical protein
MPQVVDARALPPDEVRCRLTKAIQRENSAASRPSWGTHGRLTSLHVAVAEGETEAVQVLTEAGNIGVDDRARAHGQKTALDFAVEYKHPEAVSLLIGVGAKCAVGPGGESPLRLAGRRDLVEMVGMLVCCGADVDEAHPRGVRPLHMVWEGCGACELLVEAGADADVALQLMPTLGIRSQLLEEKLRCAGAKVDEE